MRPSRCSAILVLLVLACGTGRKEAAPPRPASAGKGDSALAGARAVVRARSDTQPATDSVRRVAPPEVAHAHGWMPLASTGADRFVRAHPEYDGRGVLIGILDTGIDPAIPGLAKTTTGEPKILDLRDFSDEGVVPLSPITPTGDSVDVAGHRLGGFGTVAALGRSGPYYGGTIAEIPLGEPPAADLNGNGAVRDTLPIVVVRASDGWVMLADTDGDGSLARERPIHDYIEKRESFGWSSKGRPPRVDLAANFTESGGVPRLDLFFETWGHGTHVAGIAAGHDIYGVPGFDGVAPGAQLIGLKIANSAQGGVSRTGSMLRAMDYAIRFADARHLRLVLNLSFGVGNEIEGRARIDQLVDSILAAHPDLVLTISAGNDGPGLSTIGFPGSAARAISVGATLPGTLLPPGPNGGPSPDLLAYFSSRGGEVARPDLVAPGAAYSTVPLWNAGDEVEQGTSMAAPHVAGLVALLLSAVMKDQRPTTAREIRQALTVTAQPLPEGTVVDEGTGLPDVERAYRWLSEGPPVPDIIVRAGQASAALLRGTAGAPDTVQTFDVLQAADAPNATYRLRSDAPWLTAPASLALRGPRTSVQLRIARRALAPPAAYTGTVTGWGQDTLAGPAFHLVVTVAAGTRAAAGTEKLREDAAVPAGGILRTFFSADSGRPFALSVATGGPAERALTFLHEPNGMPARDESARSAGYGPQGVEYEPDSRDVVPGLYEVVVVAPPKQAVRATLSLTQCPLVFRASRDGETARARFTNVTAGPVETGVAMHLGGAVRSDSITGNGSEPLTIPFVVPRWSRGVVVDLSMDRAQWGRFTDFGVTLFDSLGRQLGKQPLNYAFGRLQVELPDGHGDMPVTLGLYPGFADPGGDQRWGLRTSIRVYADTSVVLAQSDSSTRTIPPRGTAAAEFALRESPWPLQPRFVPLALLVARIEGRSWTREVELAPAGTALVP